MISDSLLREIKGNLDNKKSDGTYKYERVILGAQGGEIAVSGSESRILNFCSNNYLGLSSHPDVVMAAESALKTHGFGMSSVRFICGCTDLHVELEKRISDFLLTEDSILFNSCFDANGGFFQSLLSEDDIIISASLNHASIIDGVRLCRAKKALYAYNDMADLKRVLLESSDRRIKVLVTDGVFSMEGDLAPLDAISALCEEHNALLVVDDSHATGVLGHHGRGTAELMGVHEKVDMFTGTLGKALGGATGGYISGKRELVDWFRNSSRPYLFSNSMAPAVVAGSIKSLDIVQSGEGEALRLALADNTRYFRECMRDIGFQIRDGLHPIVPIMLGEASVATGMADDLLSKEIYVIGFSYPVVPEGEARIRVQLSAIHSREQIDRAVSAFSQSGKSYGVLS
ncbi:MAG: glycine C-acetyltransferase [Spirochaetota bacterium]|nr:glycine C-acetyltransferase [Spirochaetota bacterium]